MALSAGLRRASDGCVVHPTAEELVTPAPPGSTIRHGGGVFGPDAGEAPAPPEETPIKSSSMTSNGAAVSSTPPNGRNIEQKSGAINPDDTAFVDLFVSSHRSHEVKVERVDSPPPELRERRADPEEIIYHATGWSWVRTCVELARWYH